jgi:cell division protein FtsB
VVVRGPDGEVIEHATPGRRPAAPPAKRRATPETADGPADARPGPGAGERPAARVRPRRIPGAVGAALIAPRLSPGAADDREARRARRQAAPAASVTRLIPRRRNAGEPAGGDAAAGGGARPSLRSVAARATSRGRQAVSGRGARHPAPAHPGEPRRSRVLAAVAGIESALAGADEETRERRRARLRWIGIRVSAVALVGVLLYAIFPVHAYLAQRADGQRGKEQIEVISRENRRLAQQIKDLQKDGTVEELARERLGLVKPGEESYGILPAPREGPASTTTTIAAPH